MSNKAMALIFGLLVILVLSSLLAGFLTATMSYNQRTTSYVNRIRAFWLAEAGLGKGIEALNNTTGYIGQQDYNYTTEISLINTINVSNNTTFYLYSINSTGYAKKVQRKINAIARRTVEKNNVSSNSFKYSLESTVEINVKGSVDIRGDNNCTACSGNSCSCTSTQCCKENSAISFKYLFGVNKEELKSYAESINKKYTPSNLPSVISGLVWVEGNLYIASNKNLSTEPGKTAILIVEGDASFRGNINFNGIIYVIGDLSIRGTVDVTGSVLAESSAEAETDVTGNVQLIRNGTKIDDALSSIRNIEKELSRQIICWREI